MRDMRHRASRSHSAVGAAALVAAVACSALVLAQTEVRQFVITDVIVRDSDGVFMPGLGLQDFRVLEDGVEQEIVTLIIQRAEPSDYYVLGFRAGNPDRTVRTRRLQVDLPGRAGENTRIQSRETCRAAGEVTNTEQFRAFRSQCGSR